MSCSGVVILHLNRFDSSVAEAPSYFALSVTNCEGTMLTTIGAYFANSSCGYCDESRSSRYGFMVDSMTTSQYKQLADRGFRRSGKYLYKPDLKNSCCALYTIRLDVNRYSPSKEQRKCFNRFTRMVRGDSKSLHKNGKDNIFDLVAEIDLQDQLPGEKFQIFLDNGKFTAEKHALYTKYQMSVHGDTEDECDEPQFRRFLCEAPFSKDENSTESGLVHQLYYLKGKLIAFGVLDILPSCLSSVYFVWDPDYHDFSLGKVGTMREIGLAKKLKIPYYYMGYYIHKCVKMRYKGQYRPSELLDPEWPLESETPLWYNLSDFVRKFEEGQKLVSFVRNLDEKKSEENPGRENETSKDVNVNSEKEDDFMFQSMPGRILPQSKLIQLIEEKGADMQSMKLALTQGRLDSNSAAFPIFRLENLANENIKNLVYDYLLEMVSVMGVEVIKDIIVSLDGF